MKKNLLLTLAVLSAFSSTGLAHAQTAAPASAASVPTSANTTAPAANPVVPPKKISAQQQKMKDCNAQYKQQNIPKAQHQSFMSTCLKGSSTAAATPATATPAAAATTAAPTQQQKMKSCNKDAKSQNLTGDARKTFISTCLSK